MNFLNLEPNSSNPKNILVMTDHFTKYAVTMPRPNQKVKTVVSGITLLSTMVPHSDQGPDFKFTLTVYTKSQVNFREKLQSTFLKCTKSSR